MFETLFTYSRVLRRHREGPLAEERAAYLAVLAAHSVAPATLLKQARCCLRVAVELERWPADHCFDIDEVGENGLPILSAVSGLIKPVCQGTFSLHSRRLPAPPRPSTAGPEDPSGPIRDHAVRVHRPAARTELAVRRHLPVGEMAHREVPRRPRAAGVGPADSPTSRYRCVLPAHGGAVEPEFAEPFRQVRTRMVGVLRDAGPCATRSRADHAGPRASTATRRFRWARHGRPSGACSPRLAAMIRRQSETTRSSCCCRSTGCVQACKRRCKSRPR